MKERAERRPKWLGVLARDFFFVISLILFFVYFLTAVLRFWLWLISLFFAFLATCLKLLTVPLSVLSGARPPASKPITGSTVAAADASGAGASSSRTLAVASSANAPQPLHQLMAPARSAWRSFWHYSVERKVMAITLTMLLVILPAMYVIPRPHEVQILDNNALNYPDSGVGHSSAGYVVHALDLSDPSETREYVNETVWWLGKFNTQGLKAKLRPGRYYRLWVVGWRWWYAPTLFPNIILATEIDINGNAVDPTLVPTPTTTHTP